jgi:hypothetical protein
MEIVWFIAGVIALALVSRTKRGSRCPFIEHVKTEWPAPPATKKERIALWREKYDRVHIEMTVQPINQKEGKEDEDRK